MTLSSMVFCSSAAIAYIIYCAMDLEFSKGSRVIAYAESPVSFCIILALLLIPPMIIFIGSLLLLIGSNTDQNNWLNRKIRENIQSYKRAKKEADEYNS